VRNEGQQPKPRWGRQGGAQNSSSAYRQGDWQGGAQEQGPAAVRRAEGRGAEGSQGAGGGGGGAGGGSAPSSAVAGAVAGAGAGAGAGAEAEAEAVARAEEAAACEAACASWEPASFAGVSLSPARLCAPANIAAALKRSVYLHCRIIARRSRSL
jgi:hypothetical protein